MQLIKDNQKGLIPPKTVQKNKVWFQYLPNSAQPAESRYRCRICSKYYDQIGLPQNQKPVLATERGQLYKDYKKNHEAISSHASSSMHLNIVSFLKGESAKRQRTEISQHEQTEEMNDSARLLITARMFRSVFVLNKLSLPYFDHKGLVTLQKLNGLDMGYHHYEHTGCTKMSLFMSDDMHDILIEYLVENQMPISIIVDDTTDLSAVHYMIVYFQTIEENRPVIYFYKLIEITSETGEAHFNVLISAWMNEKTAFVEYMKQNLVGFASDGHPINIGEQNGMIAYLRRWASKPLFAIHCMAHRLELVVSHAFSIDEDIEEMSEYIDKTLNEVYSFYGRSHKRKTHLKQTADSMKKFFYELKKIIDIRWVASDYNSMKALYSMWDILVKDLRMIAEDENFKQDTKKTANELKKRLIGKRFLLLFTLNFDIMSELSLFSLEMQKRSALLIDAIPMTNKFREIFTAMKTKNAKNLAMLLHEARCQKEDIYERCETLEAYLDSDSVQYENVILHNDEESFPDVIEYKNTIFDALLNQFNDYFPDGDLDIFNVLDPMSMPLPNDEASTRTYGITKIADINDYFKITNKDDIILQWQNLLLSIVISDNYCHIRTEKTSISAFWSQLLKWPEIIWDTEIKRLVQTVLSIPISSAEAERGFSTMKYLRDSRRNRLVPKTLDAMMRIKLNGPDELDYFPAARYADK